jgi:hypothetical protein
LTVYPATQAARIRLSVVPEFWLQGHELLAANGGAAAAARAAERAEGGYVASTLFVRATGPEHPGDGRYLVMPTTSVAFITVVRY